MTEPESLCIVAADLSGHVQELLDAAAITSEVTDLPDGRRQVTVAADDLEHARAVIGLVLPQLLGPGDQPPRLSDRLIRSDSDPPPLPGGLQDARPTFGYADPLEEPDDGEYVPDLPPPLPRPRDRIERAAWAGLILGPLLLVAVQVFGLPGYLTVVGLLAFFGGFGALIARMEDRPRSDDGSDDGAVV